MSLNPGAQIGPYTVSGEIGRGGMGVVYRATDTRLDRDVAIKALPEELASDPGRLERFEREAKTLASLNHPNVAGILGIEEQGGARYLVLEFVDGETLGERLDRGAMGIDDAIEVCVQIAAGVQAAHDAGVIHRDLKPSNIKITSDGVAKVLDFGLAKGDSGSETGSSLSQSPTLTTPMDRRGQTAEGAVLGTAAYMSPEQARGRGVDKRTDVWSFGVVLYECLTGIGPCVGETATDSIGAVLHKDVELGRLPAGTPRAVKHVLGRCLERDKAKRFRDIADVRIELERARDGGSVDEIAVGVVAERGVMGRIGWLVAVVALVAASVFGVMVIRGGGAEPARLVRSSVPGPEGWEIKDWTASPDGRRVAVLGKEISEDFGRGTGVQMLFVRDLAEENWEMVEGSEWTFAVRFSPDGESLVYIADRPDLVEEKRLVRVAADLSETPVEIMNVPKPFMTMGGNWFCWTAAGEIAFFSRSAQELVLYGAGTGREVRRIGARSEDGDTVSIQSFAGWFGEDHVAVSMNRFDESGYHQDVGLIRLSDGLVRLAVPDAVGARLLDNGDVLFARGDSVFTSGFDLEGCELRGELRAVQPGLRVDEVWSHGEFRLSETGQLVYPGGGYQSGERTIVLIDAGGNGERAWGVEPRSYQDMIAVTSDFTRVASIVVSPRGTFEVWVGELDRARMRRLYGGVSFDVNTPMFFPDNERLLVMVWEESAATQWKLVELSFDGTTEPRELATEDADTGLMTLRSISADGTRAMVDRSLRGENRILEVALDGSGDITEIMPDTPAWRGQFAVDDSGLISYFSDESGAWELYVRLYVDGVLGQATVVSGHEEIWRTRWGLGADGGLMIRYYDVAQQMWEVSVSVIEGRVEVGEPISAGRRMPPRTTTGDFSHDGSEIVVRMGESERLLDRLELVQGWGAWLKGQE